MIMQKQETDEHILHRLQESLKFAQDKDYSRFLV